MLERRFFNVFRFPQPIGRASRAYRKHVTNSLAADSAKQSAPTTLRTSSAVAEDVVGRRMPMLVITSLN